MNKSQGEPWIASSLRMYSLCIKSWPGHHMECTPIQTTSQIQLFYCDKREASEEVAWRSRGGACQGEQGHWLAHCLTTQGSPLRIDRTPACYHHFKVLFLACSLNPYLISQVALLLYPTMACYLVEVLKEHLLHILKRKDLFHNCTQTWCYLKKYGSENSLNDLIKQMYRYSKH